MNDDDDDDDLEEESLLETPLDKLEPYMLFKTALLSMSSNPVARTTWSLIVQLGLQQEQPQLYENVTKNLNPEEQQVIQHAVHQADAIALQQQQADLQAATAAPNGHPPSTTA